MKHIFDADHLANIEVEKLRQKQREINPPANIHRRLLIAGLATIGASAYFGAKAIEENYNPYWQNTEASYLWDVIKKQRSFQKGFVKYDIQQEQQRWRSADFKSVADNLNETARTNEVRNRLTQVNSIISQDPYSQDGKFYFVNFNNLLSNKGLIEPAKSSEPFPLSIRITYHQGVRSFILDYNPETVLSLSPRALAGWMSFANALPYTPEDKFTTGSYLPAFSAMAMLYTDLCSMTNEIFGIGESEQYKIASSFYRLGATSNSNGWKAYVESLRHRKPFI